MNKRILLPALLAFGFATATFAQSTNTPKVDKREENQQQRIANGVESGQLTAKETAKLENREARINAAEAKAKADGNVTKKERAKLGKMQNRASKAIHKQKHDGQKRH